MPRVITQTPDMHQNPNASIQDYPIKAHHAMMTHAIRIIQDPPLDGPTNMARDEAMLQSVGAALSPPTLRLYQWAAPTVSLGYFQHISDFETLPPPVGRLHVVRRTTGGGAILHDQELTYSLSLPSDHTMLCAGPNTLYAMMHDVIIECLKAYGLSAWRGCDSDNSNAARGPFFCFARRHCYDVLIDDDKIAGSAQRRTRQAILQHGSIVTGNRFEQHPTASAECDIEDTIQKLRIDIVNALTQATGLTYEPGGWTIDELDASEDLLIKYAGSEWTRRT